MKNDAVKHIIDLGVVAVIRADSDEQAINIAHACIKGGLSAIEITYTVPNADAVIRTLSATYPSDEVLVGAGTILDHKTAKEAIEAGARYVVSPGFDRKTAALCLRKNIPYLPGCLTITEMMVATKAGAPIIKLFPGSAFGPSYVKAVKGPLPMINIMPTGGVSLDNVETWIKHGVVAIGVGSELTAPAKNNDFTKVEENARAFVDAVKRARQA